MCVVMFRLVLDVFLGMIIVGLLVFMLMLCMRVWKVCWLGSIVLILWLLMVCVMCVLLKLSSRVLGMCLFSVVSVLVFFLVVNVGVLEKDIGLLCMLMMFILCWCCDSYCVLIIGFGSVIVCVVVELSRSSLVVYRFLMCIFMFIFFILFDWIV